MMAMAPTRNDYIGITCVYSSLYLLLHNNFSTESDLFFFTEQRICKAFLGKQNIHISIEEIFVFLKAQAYIKEINCSTSVLDSQLSIGNEVVALVNSSVLSYHSVYRNNPGADHVILILGEKNGAYEILDSHMSTGFGVSSTIGIVEKNHLVKGMQRAVISLNQMKRPKIDQSKILKMLYCSPQIGQELSGLEALYNCTKQISIKSESDALAYYKGANLFSIKHVIQYLIQLFSEQPMYLTLRIGLEKLLKDYNFTLTTMLKGAFQESPEYVELRLKENLTEHCHILKKLVEQNIELE